MNIHVIMNEAMATRFLLEGQPDQLLVFEAKANGASARMVLDTGAGAVLIGEAAAARLNVPATAEAVSGYGAGGPIELTPAAVDSLTIDGQDFSNLSVLISDQVDRVMGTIGVQIDGVAGYPLFAGMTLDIDFEALDFSLTREVLDQGIPFTIADHAPLVVVPGRVAGRDAMMAVDTGASATTLSIEACAWMGDDLERADSLTGAGGQIESFSVPPIEVRIGDASAVLSTVRASPFVANLSETLEIPIDAVLGLDWLKRFRVRFDYAECKLLV